MLNYIVKRTLLMIPTLLGVAIISFFLLRVVPGDIVEAKLRGDGAAVTQELIDQERKVLGLDRPLSAQFGNWMIGLVTLDLGRSMWTGRPVAEEISVRLPVSLEVALLGALAALLVAVPTGTVAALSRGSWWDYAIRLVTIGGLAVPPFWFGMIVILLLLSVFHWLPTLTYVPIYVDPIANLSQLVWPALAVGFRLAAIATRMVRSTMIEVCTKTISGQHERRVSIPIWSSSPCAPQRVNPTITVAGLEFVFLIGGLVVTEQVFNLNGIGQLFVGAVNNHDFVLIQAIVMLTATMFCIVNLAVDILNATLDARIRL
ncbi:MAG: ABC transporter permease [Pseudolabrys sp.]